MCTKPAPHSLPVRRNEICAGFFCGGQRRWWGALRDKRATCPHEQCNTVQYSWQGERCIRGWYAETRSEDLLGGSRDWLRIIHPAGYISTTTGYLPSEFEVIEMEILNRYWIRLVWCHFTDCWSKHHRQRRRFDENNGDHSYLTCLKLLNDDAKFYLLNFQLYFGPHKMLSLTKVYSKIEGERGKRVWTFELKMTKV